MGFQDESGVSEKPFVRKTWAKKGQTPIITCSGSWKKLTLSGVIITDHRGAHSRLFLRMITGSTNALEVIKFLKDLKVHLKGKKLLLFMDGLPAHKAKIVKAYIQEQKKWLRVERLPGYAPELNPIEYLWGAMKKKHFGNLRTEGLGLLAKTVRNAKKKLNNEDLLRGFLRASGLY